MGSCSSIHARNLAEAKRKVSPFNEDASGNLFHRNETGNRDEASTKKKAHNEPLQSQSSGSPLKTRELDISPHKITMEKEIHSGTLKKTIWKISTTQGKDENPQEVGTPTLKISQADHPIKIVQPLALEYKRGQLVGKGTFGEVYQCLNLNTGELMAVKTIRFNGTEEQVQAYLQMLRNQIASLRDLPHKNLIRYCYVDLVDESTPEEYIIDIVLEYGSGGSLRSIVDRFLKLEEKISAIYIKQILEVLALMHHFDIVHRDIKGSNILIDSTGTIKLSDFGFCKWFEPPAELPVEGGNIMKDVVVPIIGSVFWQAPEVIRKAAQDKAADIWSVGCLLIEMLTGIPPWSHKTREPAEVEKLILSNDAPPFPKNLTENCRDFLKDIFHSDPNDRPTAEQLLEHPYIKNHTRSHLLTVDQTEMGESMLTVTMQATMLHSMNESKGKLFETMSQKAGVNDSLRVYNVNSWKTPQGRDGSPMSGNYLTVNTSQFSSVLGGSARNFNESRWGIGGGKFNTFSKIEEQTEDDATPAIQLGNEKFSFKPQENSPRRVISIDIGSPARVANKKSHRNSNREKMNGDDVFVSRHSVSQLHDESRYKSKNSLNGNEDNRPGTPELATHTNFDSNTPENGALQKTPTLTPEEIERKRLEDRKRLEEQMMRELMEGGGDTSRSEMSESKITTRSQKSKAAEPRKLTKEEALLERKKLEEQMLLDMQMASVTETFRSDTEIIRTLTQKTNRTSNQNDKNNESFSRKDIWKVEGQKEDVEVKELSVDSDDQSSGEMVVDQNNLNEYNLQDNIREADEEEDHHELKGIENHQDLRKSGPLLKQITFND